jgi:hypothetical protein
MSHNNIEYSYRLWTVTVVSRLLCIVGVGGSSKHTTCVNLTKSFYTITMLISFPWWYKRVLSNETLVDSILIYIQEDATLHSLLYLETALHVLGGTITHHQEHNSIYSIWYLSHHYCYLLLSWKSWNWFECAVGGVHHPQHTQTRSESNRTTILYLIMI